MKLVRISTLIALAASMALLIAACDDGGGVTLSTSSTVLGGSGGPATTSTLGGDTTGGSTSTTRGAVGTTVESFDIMSRESDDSGETLYILIPQATYTDVDLENFVGELIDSDTATWGAEIFDDVAALDAYLKPEAQRTEKEQTLIDEHHFASLVEGDTIVFRGPFESSGQILIGS